MRFKFFAVGLAGWIGITTFVARADLEVSAAFTIRAEADFHAPLSVHGAWINVGNYGRCWRPARVGAGWRPYCYGRWVWTDCGWYWESDEPWAWACYHYGYWVQDAVHGWVWIPGIEWGPAWVSWRVGGGFIGWAPLAPPHGTIILGAPHFVFVKSARFHETHRPSRVLVNNTTIINNTTVINNIKREDRVLDGRPAKVVINDGPGVEAVQSAVGRKIEPVKIQEAARRTRVPAGLSKRTAESPDQPASTTAPEAKRTTPGDKNKRLPPTETPDQRPGTSPGQDRDDAVAPGPEPRNPPGGKSGKPPKFKEPRGGKDSPRGKPGRGRETP